MSVWPDLIETERLVVRRPVESDRASMVELWTTPSFMVFTPNGAMGHQRANDRFDRMLERAGEIPFAKQPVIERATGRVVGYTGVDVLDFEGGPRLEWGYRLDESVRGRGYATEASMALLAAADKYGRLSKVPGVVDPDTLYAIIDPANHPSQNVAAKLGFTFWKTSTIDGGRYNLYRRRLGYTGTGVGRPDGAGPV